jgi:myo-inositol-1(or 4)-monophosphatase
MNREFEKIVREAGEIIKRGFSEEKDIDFKGRVDLVTKFDLEVELFLKSRVQKLYPDFEIVGEETSSESLGTASKKIYIDPIDGTTNFVHSLPFVAISIGIWEDGEPLEGVVYNPILDELFYAKRNSGAFLNGKKISVSSRDSLQDGLISTGFPYTKVEKGDDYEWTVKVFSEILPRCRDVRRYGSASLDLAYLSKGTFDGYYELNLQPWDVSAGILLVEEAGGEIRNHSGEKYKIEVDRVIVATNGKVGELNSIVSSVELR